VKKRLEAERAKQSTFRVSILRGLVVEQEEKS